MPEGHSIHRLARQFHDVFAGSPLAVSSPQGKFADGAALLDGHTLVRSLAQGKHLFLHFDQGLVLHVHLGLYGAWDFGGDESFTGASSIGAPRKVGEREVFADDASATYAGPPEPVGAVRVRLVSAHGWADLRGATTCAVITESEAAGVRARLGPDPLWNLSEGKGLFVNGVLSRQTPLAALLMDQKVIAGVGNVYRAEVLFRQGIDPWLPGKSLSVRAAELLWEDIASVMNDGVRDGRIITTPSSHWRQAALPEPEDAHFVYKRNGRPCRICDTDVAVAELYARKLYWCPACQKQA